MKALYLLFLTGALCSAQPVRLVGTNAVDFSLVYKELGSSSETWCRRYLVTGVVRSSDENGATVVQTGTRYEFRPSSSTLRYGGTSDFLRMAAANQIASSGDVSLGQILAMDPSMRANFTPVETKKYFYVANCAKQTIGQSVVLIAWPTGKTLKGASVYEYGRPITQRNEEAALKILHVGPNGLYATELQSKEEIRASEKRVIAIQQRDATNGSGSAQYELGLRYLRGRGVQTNTELAIMWLSSAKTNGYSEASSKLLDSLKP